MLGRDYIEEYRLAIVKAGACDPNVLGIISDFVLEVDAIDICMVFSVIKNGVKLSFRSCIKAVSYTHLARKSLLMRSKEVKYKGMRRIRKTRLCNLNAIKQRVTEHNVKSIMY